MAATVKTITYGIDINKKSASEKIKEFEAEMQQLGDFHKRNLKELTLKLKTNIDKTGSINELKAYQKEIQGILAKFASGATPFDYKKVYFLNKELESSKKILNRFPNPLEKTSGFFSKTIGDIKMAWMVGFTAIKKAWDMVAGSIKDAASAARTDMILDNALKQVGTTAKAVKLDIEELAKTNIVEDDQIKQIYNYALAMGIPKEKLKQFAQTALDFSAQSGKGLEMAMRTITAEVKKGGAQFDKLTESVKGAARESADADGGITRLGLSTKKLSEGFGTLILNGLKPLITEIARIAGWVAGLIDKINAGIAKGKGGFDIGDQWNEKKQIWEVVVKVTDIELAKQSEEKIKNIRKDIEKAINQLGNSNKKTDWLGLEASFAELETGLPTDMQEKLKGMRTNIQRDMGGSILFGLSKEKMDKATKDYLDFYDELMNKTKTAIKSKKTTAGLDLPIISEDLKKAQKELNDLKSQNALKEMPLIDQLNYKQEKLLGIETQIRILKGESVEKENLMIEAEKIRADVGVTITKVQEDQNKKTQETLDNLKSISGSFEDILNNSAGLDDNTKKTIISTLQLADTLIAVAESERTAKALSGDWLAIIATALTIFSGIWKWLQSILTGTNQTNAAASEYQKQLDSINSEMEKIKTQLEIIKLLEEGINYQHHLDQEDVKNLIKLKQDEIDTKKRSLDMDNEQIKIRKDRMGDIRNEINALNEMKKKYGQLAGMFQAMIDSLFYQYTSLSGEIDAINIEILGTQNGLLISQQELNDLMVEYYQIVVDIDEAQIGLLESEMKYATPEDKLKYQQQINDFIKDEIKQLGDELGITDDINDQLKLKTEIQDLQNTLMEQETEEMKKQYDYLTKFLDLQNLSDLRDLQKMNENLGYQGLGLMAQMADQGVSQAAMAAAGVDRSLKVANLNVNNYGTGVDSVAANLMYAVNRMWLVR